MILDSFGGKPVAFKYGQRPFQNVVCEGLEEGSCGRLRVPRRLGGALVGPWWGLDGALVVPWCRLGAVIVPPRWCLGAASVVQQRSSYSGHLCSSSCSGRLARGTRGFRHLRRPDASGRLWVLPLACPKVAHCVP